MPSLCHHYAIGTMPSPCHHYAIGTMPSLCHHYASSTMPAAPCHHYLQLCLCVFDGAVGRCADLQCTQEDISAVLAEWSNTCNLILTTGGSTKHKYKHVLSHCALSTAQPDFELIRCFTFSCECVHVHLRSLSTQSCYSLQLYWA